MEKLKDSPFSTVDIAGLPLSISNPHDAFERLASVAKAPQSTGLAVHLINAYSIALAQSDKVYGGILKNSRCNLPDGKPLSWVGRLLSRGFHQVRGPQLFENLLAHGQNYGLRHYLLGASPETLALLRSEIGQRYPKALVVGAESPPFRPLTHSELAEQDERVIQSRADVVWVGLGTPKQDFEVERIAQNIPVVAVAVGAAFDFLAGSKPEAPKWMSPLGIEWVFRLLTEPRRLWRRYLVGNLVFIGAVLRGVSK